MEVTMVLLCSWDSDFYEMLYEHCMVYSDIIVTPLNQDSNTWNNSDILVFLYVSVSVPQLPFLQCVENHKCFHFNPPLRDSAWKYPGADIEVLSFH